MSGGSGFGLVKFRQPNDDNFIIHPTDASGTGTADLFRSVAAFPEGTPFDIHLQVIDDATGAVVLASECYQFVISR